jgi:hypothetical protein
MTMPVSFPPYYPLLFAIVLVAAVIFVILMVISPKQYPVKSIEQSAVSFANDREREAAGHLPLWLWVSFAAIVIWAFAYIIINWADFMQFPYILLMP